MSAGDPVATGAGGGDPDGFEGFARRVAEATGMPADAIQPDARLVEDLGLDSLAVMEVVVVLLVDYELEGLSDRLLATGLSGVTVADVYKHALDTGPSRWRVQME